MSKAVNRTEAPGKRANKRDAKRRNTAKRVAGQLAWGTAAAAAVYLGAGDDAEAGIVHFAAPGNSFTVTGNADTEIWDIDNNGVDDYFFTATTLGFEPVSMNVFNDASGGRGLVNKTGDSATSFRNLSVGFLVGPALAAGYQFATTSIRTATEGGAFVGALDFTSGVDGYIGFKFDVDGVGNDQLRYGWARINITPANNAGHEFSVLEWAYEDTGAGINVGAVPEPSSVALLGQGLLSCGAAGVRRWKREKKQRAEA